MCELLSFFVCHLTNCLQAIAARAGSPSCGKVAGSLSEGSGPSCLASAPVVSFQILGIPGTRPGTDIVASLHLRSESSDRGFP